MIVGEHNRSGVALFAAEGVSKQSYGVRADASASSVALGLDTNTLCTDARSEFSNEIDAIIVRALGPKP